MLVEPIESPDAPPAEGAYAQALRVTGADELLFVSGQVPVDTAGAVPAAFADQCHLVWRNIEAQLRAAGMGFGDIVKVTTFLSHRAYAEENSKIRRALLAGHAPALTVVIADIFDPAWLLEVEAIAARRAA